MTDDTSEHYSISAGADDEGQRLDRFLSDKLEHVSRTRVKALIQDCRIVQNGDTIVEPSYRVKSGDVFEISLPPTEPAEPEGEAIPLDIVFEDDALLVLDKPAGLVVHPAAGHRSGTLVNALIAHCGESLSGIGGVKRPGIVHRLDKNTTGLMVVAKTDAAHKSLTAQFADHGRRGPLERLYYAFVWGEPRPSKGVIDAPLGRQPSNRQKIAVVRSGGREAVTHYKITETYGRLAGQKKRGLTEAVASLVECRLETGRTHQIRVHMAHIGHPLIGDSVYGTGFKSKANALGEEVRNAISKLARQALHAAKLTFQHPVTQKIMEFESPLPEDLKKLRKSLFDVTSGG